MPTKEIAVLDDVQAALFMMIKSDLDRKISEANAQAAVRFAVLRKGVGCPDGPKLDFSDGPNGSIVATWDTPDERKIALVGDVGKDGMSASAEVAK